MDACARVVFTPFITRGRVCNIVISLLLFDCRIRNVDWIIKGTRPIHIIINYR